MNAPVCLFPRRMGPGDLLLITRVSYGDCEGQVPLTTDFGSAA